LHATAIDNSKNVTMIRTVYPARESPIQKCPIF